MPKLQPNKRINGRNGEVQNKCEKEAHHLRAMSHSIDLDNTRVIANIAHTTRRIITEAIVIENRFNNRNKRDDTSHLPTTWKPALNSTPKISE